MDRYKIKSVYKRTPCKGHLIGTDISNQKDIFIFVNQQLYSRGDFFSEIIKYIYVKENEWNEIEYSTTCVIPNIKTYIEVSTIKPITSKNSYICQIDQTNYKNLPVRFYSDNTTGKLIFSLNFIEQVISYLKKINANFLFFEKESTITFSDGTTNPITIIIFPDIVSNPIDKNDVMIYNTDINNDSEKTYNYLSKIEFYSVIKYQDRLYSADNIIELFESNRKEDIIKIVNKMKETINEYIELYFKQTYNYIILNLYICTEYEYGNFIIKFDILNNIESTTYVSFIEGQRWVNYQDYINIINFGNLKYTSKFYDDIDGDISVICGENHLYRLQKIINNKIISEQKQISSYSRNKNPQRIDEQNWRSKPKTYSFAKSINTLFKDGFKIVNYFWRPSYTLEKAYCIQSLLLLTFKDNIKSYHEIIFRSNLFEYLDKKFINPTRDQIWSIINKQEPVFSVGLQSKIFIGYTNWHGTFTIRKLGTEKSPYTIPLVIPIIEKKLDADRIDEIIIKENPFIDNTIVIAQSIIALEKYSDNPAYESIKKHMEKNQILKGLLSKKYLSNESNFYIAEKKISSSGIIKESAYYRMWYYSKTQIIDITKFEDAILGININATYNDIRRDSNLHSNLKSATNFYALFADMNTFIYNARYLKNTYKKEIDDFINNFLYFKYYVEQGLYDGTYDEFDIEKINLRKTDINKFKKYKTYPYFIWINYPNQFDYNIFHIHMARMEDIKEFDPDVLYNKNVRYQLSLSRAFDWSYMKNIDFENTDIIQIHKFNLHDTVESTIDDLINFMKKIKRTLSLKYIDKVTINIIKNIVNKHRLTNDNIALDDLYNKIQKNISI